MLYVHHEPHLSRAGCLTAWRALKLAVLNCSKFRNAKGTDIAPLKHGTNHVQVSDCVVAAIT